MNLNGVLVPVVTPFTADNQVDVDSLNKLVQVFIDSGVTGVVVCGTTGEYYTLSETERELVLKTVSDKAKGKLKLIAGANGMNTAESIAKVKQAKDLGYEAIMVAAPSYSLPMEHEVEKHFEMVANSTDLPIILYNFPMRVGVEISIDTVINLSKIPNIIGIKESSGDFSRALALINLKLDGFEVVCGCDDQSADFLFWGVTSWISGGANVFPAEQVQMMQAAESNDWDKVKQLLKGMLPSIQSMEAGDYNQKAKLGCIRHGLDIQDVRMPLVNLSSQDADEFKKLITQYDNK